MYDMHPDSEVIPHNIEAEQLVLGALLSDNERLTAISGLVTAESFYDPVHAEIYTRIVGRAESGQLASPITLKTDLAGHEGFQTLGGGAYLARLAATPGHSQIREYASLLSDLKAKRDLLTHLRTAREKITDGREGAAKIASGLETSAGAVLASSSLKPLIRSHLSSLTGALTRINDAYRGEKPPGVSSGLPQLDNMMGFFRPGNFIVLAGRPSMGKAQPLDAQVLTTTGFKRMGDLRLGETLVSRDGAPSRVTGIYPQGKRQTYRVTFSDGRSTRCCAEHLWSVTSSRMSGEQVLTTDDLSRKISTERYKRQISIPVVSGHFGSISDLSVDPWLLGAIIGNACLTQGTPRISTADAQTLWQVQHAIGPSQRMAAMNGYDYSISGTSHGKNDLTDALKILGMMDCRAEEKFIPPQYLLASREDRIQLLRGLMDTDGWVETFGAVRYSTSSERLARDVQSLVRSLGGLCKISGKSPRFTYKGETRTGQDHFICNIRDQDAERFFTLIRKKRRCVRQKPVRLTIVSIEPDAVEQVQCISISHPSRLYVTDDYILTHNTTIAQNFAYHAATHGVGVFYGSFEMDGEDLGTRFLSLGLASKGKRVPYNRMIKGQLSESEMRDVVDETKAQMDLPLEFGERDVREVSVLRSAVKRARQKMADTPAPLGLVIVDYLQQLHSAKARSAYEHVSAASDACKSLAMELGVPVVALAQLSRNVEQRDPPVPMLADLRESGKVEEDADAVIFTYRDAYYIQRKLDGLDGRDLDAENDLRLALSRCARNVDLIVSKQRSGPTGTATAFIDPACCLVTPDLSSEERMLI